MEDYYGNEITKNVSQAAIQGGLIGRQVFRKDDYHGVLDTKFLDEDRGQGSVVFENNEGNVEIMAMYFMRNGNMVYGVIPEEKLGCVQRELTNTGTLADTVKSLDIKIHVIQMKNQTPQLNTEGKQ